MTVEPDGTKLWYNKDRQLHRIDGPAVIWPDGYVTWWLNGNLYSFTEWADQLKLDPKKRLQMVLKWNTL